MTEFSDELLDAYSEAGDPLADWCVQTLLDRAQGPRASRTLLSALSAGEMPQAPEVDAFVRESAALPRWVDNDALTEASAFFEREQQGVMTVLGFAALPESYCNARVARTLASGSALEADPTRRIGRTGTFVASVLSHRGLADGAPGRRAILQLRLLHAAVRAAGDSGRARGEGAVALVNQEDLAATLLTLSWLTAVRLPRLGVRVSARTAYAYVHTWNVIGWLLGIDERLLPASADDAAALAEAIRRRRYHPTPEGRALAGALLQTHSAWMSIAEARELMRRLLGDELADMLSL